jgi:CRP-like cAMP-binding protein/rhodanese-related sulfurtransferase
MTEEGRNDSVISQSGIFAQIPQDKLLEIAGTVEEKLAPANTIIFRQGDPGDSLYIINTGRVRVYRKSDEGVEVDLAQLGPKQSFGEMALMTGQPRSAYVEALEETHLTVLRKDQFDRILGEHPHISSNFVRLLSSWLVRDELRLQQEAERRARVPNLRLLDLVVILGLSLLFGLIFNLSNPNGIRLIPEFWSDETVPKVALPVARSRHAEGSTLFIDARPPNFFQMERIKGAINIPPSFFDILYTLELGDVDKEQEIILYGRTISRMYDEQVARKLILLEHKNTKILQGGLNLWKKQGYPVEP